MLRLFDAITKHSMGKKIGVDATLTFDPEGHLQCHKVICTEEAV